MFSFWPFATTEENHLETFLHRLETTTKARVVKNYAGVFSIHENASGSYFTIFAGPRMDILDKSVEYVLEIRETLHPARKTWGELASWFELRGVQIRNDSSDKRSVMFKFKKEGLAKEAPVEWENIEYKLYLDLENTFQVKKVVV